jgi:hypothetical protein
MDRKKKCRGITSILLLGMAFLLAACSHMVKVNNDHVVYQYGLPTVSKIQYAPGSVIKLTWQAIAINDVTPSAYPIVLSTLLTEKQDGKGKVLDKATITTNNWDGRNYIMTVHIAENVPFGNYYLTQSVRMQVANTFETTKAGGTFITVRSS